MLFFFFAKSKFSFGVIGHSTPAIQYSYGSAALKHVLEAIPGMGTVTVETTADGNGNAPICGKSYEAVTTITMNNFVGPTPPRMYVTSGSSADSRLSPKGSNTLSGGTVALYMQTSFTLTCPACPGCTGAIWFTYGDSISDEVLLVYDYSSAATAISTAIAGLADLVDAEWEDLVVSVTAFGDDTSVCVSGAENSFTVSLQSKYGNIPALQMVGTAMQGEELFVSLTWSSAVHQEGTPQQCSGQGKCNTTSGRCECSRFYEDTKLQFEMISSDGNKQPGSRGDCGFYKRTRLSTVSAACSSATNETSGSRVLCSGHGECISTLSDACSCYSGWSGILCDVAVTCPSGLAWFDEPISATVAHQPAVCSNMGHCDYITGRCKCREGFHGAACQYMDCPRDSETGRPCGSNGWCMNMNKWAEIAGFEYGDESNHRVEPGAWDAFGFHACMCSAGHPTPYSLAGTSNTLYPTVGPQSVVNGLSTETPSLPGWRGYACQERNCPSGNRIVSPSTDSAAEAVFEEQIVECYGDNTTNSSFILSFYDHSTALITGNMLADDIKAAIEWPPTIGNVTVSFLNNSYFACQRSHRPGDGFVVRFDTELGDLPLLSEVSTINAELNISQRVAGTLVIFHLLFRCLISIVPYICTRLMKNVAAFLREYATEVLVPVCVTVAFAHPVE